MDETNKKIIRVTNDKLLELIKGFIPSSMFELVVSNEEIQEEAFLVTSSYSDCEETMTPSLLIGPFEGDSSNFILNSKIKAVLDPKCLKHKVGETFFLRVLGLSSSLGLETQFESSGVSFRNFRLMDAFSQGHYSDLIVTEAVKVGVHQVVPRVYFNSVFTYLCELQSKKKVDFPIEVDYGAFKDCFVIQIHCSYEDINKEMILGSFHNYETTTPLKGLLKLVSHQTDILDIYCLESSKRLVMTGVWFNSKFKGVSGISPSIMVHHIPNFKLASDQLSANPVRFAGNTKGSPEAILIDKIENLELKDVAQKIFGKDLTPEETEQWVRGLTVDEEDFVRVQGRFEVDDSFIRIKEGQPVTDEEMWKFKKSAIIARLEEKIVVNGSIQECPQDFKQIIKNQLGIQDDQVDIVLDTDHVETYLPGENLKQLWSENKREDFKKDHEILKRDAQIHKMKGLIDRMKAELSSRASMPMGSSASAMEAALESHERLVDSKNKKIESLEKRVDNLIQNRLEQDLDQSERQAFNETIKENENLKNQLEAANKRLTAINENIEAKTKQQTERLTREVDGFKKQNQIAHQFMQASKKEKLNFENEIATLKTENASLIERLSQLETAEQNSNLETELQEKDQLLKDSLNKIRQLEDEVKKSSLAIKKFDQKNKFLTSQLEIAQKAAAGHVGVKGQKGNPERAQQVREEKMQKVLDSLKANEDRLNSEIALKKEELHKLKSENTALQNKLNEQEKKISKFEKQAA